MSYELLKLAIRQKQQVTAHYQGKRREFCPHALGKKDGIEHCMAYQFGGESSKPLKPIGSGGNWRCFIVSALTNVMLRDGQWHTSPKHDGPHQDCIVDLDIEASR